MSKDRSNKTPKAEPDPRKDAFHTSGEPEVMIGERAVSFVEDHPNASYYEVGEYVWELIRDFSAELHAAGRDSFIGWDVAVDPMAVTQPVSPRLTTGVLRANLQPLVFLTLTEPMEGLEGETVVAAQFWGGGLIALTNLAGDRVMVPEGKVRGALMAGGQTVGPAELRIRTQPVRRVQVLEDAPAVDGNGPLKAGTLASVQFWGGGITALTTDDGSVRPYKSSVFTDQIAIGWVEV